ncbi:MAG: GNAT family N-acetyltransferase [Sphingomonadales bacterium]
MHQGWAHLALRHGGAARLPADYGPFAALAPGADPADLAGLAQPGEELWLVEPEPAAAPPGFTVTRTAQLLQMLAPIAPVTVDDGLAVVPLGDADASAMQALAALTQPGPFGPQTHRLSQFLGVKDAAGRLLTMAGERMHFDGHAEVSGVCTHPEAQGRGLAAALSRRIMARIMARGQRPFLHVWPHNHGAIALYERLGLARSGAPWLTVVGRDMVD